MKSLIDAKISKRFYIKYKALFQAACIVLMLILFIWIWHYSNVDDSDGKFYAFQAIAEIIVAVFETIATFLMLTSIKQNGAANREMRKMNERLQLSMTEQTNLLKKRKN